MRGFRKGGFLIRDCASGAVEHHMKTHREALLGSNLSARRPRFIPLLQISTTSGSRGTKFIIPRLLRDVRISDAGPPGDDHYYLQSVLTET